MASRHRLLKCREIPLAGRTGWEPGREVVARENQRQHTLVSPDAATGEETRQAKALMLCGRREGEAARAAPQSMLLNRLADPGRLAFKSKDQNSSGDL